MSEAGTSAKNPYAVPLATLERQSQVGPELQVTEIPNGADDAAAWAWDEQRRQAQLAGGA